MRKILKMRGLISFLLFVFANQIMLLTESDIQGTPNQINGPVNGYPFTGEEKWLVKVRGLGFQCQNPPACGHHLPHPVCGHLLTSPLKPLSAGDGTSGRE